MKNWIRSILVIISVLSLAKCEIKFLVDTNFMELNEYVLYLNGFINGTQLYKVAPNIAGCEVSDANLYTSIRDFYIYFNNNTWNDKSGSFVKRPGKGWLHPDDKLQSDEIVYNIKVIIINY